MELIGVEAGGKNKKQTAASINYGEPGILHGNKSFYIQDDDGQISETYSISAGLDYPGIGPEHAHLFKSKRAKYVLATDNDALKAFHLLPKLEGIIPALEPSHALGYLLKNAKKYKKSDIIILNLCGRGDKDIDHILSLEKNAK